MGSSVDAGIGKCDGAPGDFVGDGIGSFVGAVLPRLTNMHHNINKRGIEHTRRRLLVVSFLAPARSLGMLVGGPHGPSLN